MYDAMQYIENLSTLWPKDKGKIFSVHLYYNLKIT